MGAIFRNSGILDMVSNIVNPANQQTTQPTGITSIPVTNQNPTVNMTGGRFNPVRDPRLNRIISRPMFRTSRYDNQINELLNRLVPQTENKANGGRAGYENGGSSKTPPKFIPMDMESVARRLFERNLDNLTYNEKQTVYDYIEQNRNKKANGGRIGYADGSPAAGAVFVGPWEGPWNGPQLLGGPRTGQYYNESSLISKPEINTTSQIDSIKESIMSLPLTRSNPQMNAMRKYSQIRDPRMMRLMQMLKRQSAARGGIMNLRMGGTPVEMDLRARGGFVPIGKKERADDVPARLSKNEFVFTANAVRNAGEGDIRKGAKRMYNLMHKLEAKR